MAKTLTINLPDGLYDQLSKISEENYQTKSEVIRQAILRRFKND